MHISYCAGDADRLVNKVLSHKEVLFVCLLTGERTLET
jgi:hypothetical protein